MTSEEKLECLGDALANELASLDDDDVGFVLVLAYHDGTGLTVRGMLPTADEQTYVDAAATLLTRAQRALATKGREVQRSPLA